MTDFFESLLRVAILYVFAGVLTIVLVDAIAGPHTWSATDSDAVRWVAVFATMACEFVPVGVFAAAYHKAFTPKKEEEK